METTNPSMEASGGTRVGVITPSSVVTFLLTDIADSTRLWEMAPLAMAEALVRHDAIIRDLVTAEGGRLIKPRGEGDSTFSVFGQPRAAAAAALAIQDAMTVERWPGQTPIRVRIAIHTGEAFGLDGDYYGPVVNRVARLRGSATPGQVLVTATVAELISDHLRAGAVLLPMGQQSLRGLKNPEYVYRLQRPPVGSPPRPPGDEPPEAKGVPFPARLATFAATGFVGRDQELETLARRAGRVAGGGVGLVLLSGEPGIGKTRLAAEAARAAQKAGMTVLYGRCDQELGIPYQPFVEALCQYIESAPTDRLDRYAARYGGDLARLIPALAQRAAWLSSPATSDPETERYLLFEAVMRLLEMASEAAPVLLVLDDLHWADRNTLLLLRHAVESTVALRLLIVGAYRHSEIIPGHPLPDLLAALARVPAAERLGLAGLDDAELGNFVAALGGHGLDERAEALVRWLHRETDGNPFFAEAILRHLTDSGAVRREDDGGWVVVAKVDDLAPPESVVEVIQQRVAHLGKPAQRALTSAAVIGREFDIALLAATLAETEDEVLTALELACAAALVSEVAARPGRFTFTHALVGHSLYQGLGATRRARLHRRVAEHLEALCGDDPGERLPELAAHWLAARVPGEAARTIDYARRTGDHALERLAPDEAVRWYERALTLATEVAADERLRVDLLIRLGVAERQAGDIRSRPTLLEAAALAERLGDKEALVRAALANNRGDRSVSGRVDRERLRVLETALAAVGEDDSSARARLLATLGLESNFGGGWEQQLAFSDEALATARRFGDPATVAAVLALRHETIRLPHTLPERLRNTAEHLETAERLGDPAQIGFAALWRSRAAWEAGDLAEVDRCMTIVTDLAGVHPYLRWNVATHWSYRHLLEGRIDEAERCTHKAFCIGEAVGQPDAGAFLAGQLINVRWDQGRLGELEQMLEAVVRDYPGLPAFRAVLALACCEAGRLDRAQWLFEREAVSGFAAFPYDPLWLCSFLLLAEVCVQLRDSAQAPALYERLAPWRAQLGFSGVSLFGSVAHYLGQLATTMGRYDTAEADFAEASSVYERLGAPIFLARTRLAWAGMLAERAGPGDHDRSAAMAEAALAVALRLGAAGLVERARRLLPITLNGLNCRPR